MMSLEQFHCERIADSGSTGIGSGGAPWEALRGREGEAAGGPAICRPNPDVLTRVILPVCTLEFIAIQRRVINSS